MKLFMDFDGVLNSIKVNPQDKKKLLRITGFDDFEKVEMQVSGRTYPIWLSEQRNELVRQIAEKVDFVWLTTWVPIGYIDKVQGWIGVEGRVPHNIFTDSIGGEHGSLMLQSWKEKTVLDETDDGWKPYIWCDDDAIRTSYRHANKSKNKPGLLISPSQYYGLTRNHFDDIFEYSETNKTFDRKIEREDIYDS